MVFQWKTYKNMPAESGGSLSDAMIVFSVRYTMNPHSYRY